MKQIPLLLLTLALLLPLTSATAEAAIEPATGTAIAVSPASTGATLALDPLFTPAQQPKTAATALQLDFSCNYTTVQECLDCCQDWVRACKAACGTNYSCQFQCMSTGQTLSAQCYY